MKTEHPLHSIDFIVDCYRSTGRHPGERRTGRSTARALLLLSSAITHQGKTITIEDHHGTRLADTFLRKTMQDMCVKLGLQHMQFSDNTVTFKLKE